MLKFVSIQLPRFTRSRSWQSLTLSSNGGRERPGRDADGRDPESLNTLARKQTQQSGPVRGQHFVPACPIFLVFPADLAYSGSEDSDHFEDTSKNACGNARWGERCSL